jgi:hypothetical protein
VIDVDTGYAFRPLPIGGGGFVTGLTVPAGTTDLAYARTDVGGAYRWDGSSWTQLIVEGAIGDEAVGDYGSNYERALQDLTNDYIVESLAVDPFNPQRLLLSVGASEEPGLGRILISDDGGRSFASGSQRFSFAGDRLSGDRGGAERIAFDPRNSSIVALATRSEGLWLSRDAGETFERVAEDALPLGNEVDGVRYALFDIESAEFEGGSSWLFVGVQGDGVFRVDLATGDVTPMLESDGGLSDASFDAQKRLVLGVGDRLLREDQVSATWDDITPPDANVSSWVLALDPNDANRVVAGNIGLHSRGWFYSTDAGATWSPRTKVLEGNGIDWTEDAGFKEYFLVGRMQFDPNNTDRLWLSHGAGVWTADDLTTEDVTLTNRSAGIEELIAVDITAPPGSPVITASLDFQGFRHETLTSPPNRMVFANDLRSASALDYSGGDPRFIAIAAGITHRPDLGCSLSLPCFGGSGYSSDSGVTWTEFAPMIEGETEETARRRLAGGNIAVSAGATTSSSTMLWAPTNDESLFRSQDAGVTWEELDVWDEFPLRHPPLGYSRRMLESDKVQPGVFYALLRREDFTPALLRSTDDGATWEVTQQFLPFKGGGEFAFHSQVRATPGVGGHLWFSGAIGGLFRSRDGGVNIEQVDVFDEANALGFGAASTGMSYPMIYVHGSIEGDWGIWSSLDDGETWLKVTDAPAGNYNVITTVNGDMNTPKRVYIGTLGNGFFVGEPAAT